jgi:signal transduction histidine kinase
MQLGMAIQRVRAEEALARAKDGLEAKVKERTADLKRLNRDLANEVSRRRRAQESLQERETRLRLLLDQIPCLSWTTDTRLRLTLSRGAALQEWDLFPDQVAGMSLAAYYKVEDPDFVPYVAHRRALQGIASTFEFGWAGRSLYARVEPLRDAEDNVIGVAGAALDITAVKQAEEQLRNLSRRLVSLQEDERRKIARELHDEIGQNLTALKMLLDKASPAAVEGSASELREARETLRELMNRVRNLSLELRPAMLDDLGLLPTLQWHFKRYTSQTRVKVDFRHAGLRVDLSPEVTSTAYRIVQEALTNVARHAKVPEVMVSIRTEGDALLLEVEDHGAGFDRAKVPSTCVGLSGMRERVLSLGGNLLVKSAPGEGTCLRAELPLLAEKVGKG